MKKRAFFAALAALAVVGCNKQEIENPVDSGRNIVVHVTAENNPTRGDYNDEGQFIWTAGDQIGVNMYDVEGGHSYGTWSAPLKLTGGANTPDGTFAFEGTNPSYVHYGTAAFYPYDGTSQPASNVGGDGNMYFYLPAMIDYKEGVNRMMLVGALEQDATDIKLYQAGAGIRISLKDIPARATKVSLTVEGKSIAGIWPEIAPADAGTAAATAPTGGGSTVTYNIPQSEAVRDMAFTFAVPVQEYANARLTVTVADNGGTIWTKGGKIKTSPNRGEILSMPELTIVDPVNVFYLSYRDGSGNAHSKVLKFSKGSGTAENPFTVTGSLPEVGYAYIERGDGVTYNFPSYVEGDTGIAYIEYGGSHPNEVMHIAPNDVLKYSLVINDANSVTLSYEVVAIDLGLSVKWARMNVGASSPEEKGSYFAWGETEPKTSFTESNYLYTGTEQVLSASNDAATANWGKDWRMPTQAEWEELLENSTWSGTTATSKVNNASIVLPEGDCYTESSIRPFYTGGYYWSSTLRYSQYSYYFRNKNNTQLIDYIGNWVGMSIRPVYDPK